MNNKKILAVLLILVAVCFAVRLFNFVGIGTNDDVTYIHNARSLAGGNFQQIQTQIGFRSGMVLPLAVLYKIFGMNEAAFAVYPIICSLLTCTFVFLTALNLWGLAPAIFASLLWIVYPLQIVFDTQLSPSNQQATCVAAALFFYFHAAKNKLFDSKLPEITGWHRPALLVLGGMFLGYAWLANEIFVTFVFVVLPFLFLIRPKIKDLLWITAGFAIVFFIEIMVLKIVTGSWFARFKCILDTERVITSNKERSYLPRTLFKVFGVVPLYEEGHFGIIWYLFIIVTIFTFFMKDKLPLALALGCWLWLAYIQWGIQSPEGTPIARYIRYISMIVPLQCLVFAAVFGKFLKVSKKFSPLVIIIFALLAVNLYWYGTKAVRQIKIHTEDYKIIAEILLDLKLEKDEIVYTDFLSGDFIEVYTKEKVKFLMGTITDKNVMTDMPEPQRGILLYNGSRAAFELEPFRNTMPQWYLNPPEHWEIIAVVRGRDMDIYQNFDPVIYRILPDESKGDSN
ncbi:MAG: hypothetical protein WCZ89_01130 [Phycisphaerae bacterium]